MAALHGPVDSAGGAMPRRPADGAGPSPAAEPAHDTVAIHINDHAAGYAQVHARRRGPRDAHRD
jgi:hypothetical protein